MRSGRLSALCGALALSFAAPADAQTTADAAPRQALQATLFVDAPHGAPINTSAAGPTLDEEQRRLLACNWSGGYCWTRGPAPAVRQDQNSAYYPADAHQAEREARILVACVVGADRRAECSAENEGPEGQSFGANAVRLVTDTAAQLNLEPGAAFRVPVQFILHRPGNFPNRPSTWDMRPSGEDFARVYPTGAMERNLDGRTLLICEIQADRRLDCDVAVENPHNEGFGNAALTLTARFRLGEAAFGTPGYTVGERIRVPISFFIA
jgi:hypothetical protein